MLAANRHTHFEVGVEQTQSIPFLLRAAVGRDLQWHTAVAMVTPPASTAARRGCVRACLLVC